MTTNMTGNDTQAIPGWYDDPENPGSLRYWNGSSWNAPEKTGMSGGKKVAIGIGVAIAVFFGIAVIAGMSGTTEQSAPVENDAEIVAPEQPGSEALPVEPPAEDIVEVEPSLTVSQENAIRKAESYLDVSGFSKEGLVEQLEFEGFSNKDAAFAVNNIDVDWNEQAARKAENYLDVSGFSRQGLIEQLEFEGFTAKQAAYGAKSVGL